MTKIKGIDISTWQGKVSLDNFKKIKADGINFVILRLGYTGTSSGKCNLDDTFENNYKNAIAVGLPVGVYYYSGTKGETSAKTEAEFVLSHIKGKNITYPVYLDVEENSNSGKCSKDTLAKACNAFCKVINAAGYTAGIYASKSWFESKIGTITAPHTKWVAQYYTSCTYKGAYDIWQYSSSGKVNGLSGKIDMNYCYKDFTSDKTTTEPEKEEVKEKEFSPKKDIQHYPGNWPDWVTLTGEIIAENARQSAWPSGTAKSKRIWSQGDSIKDPNPHRYGKYGENLDKAFPNRAKSWSAQCACGASCDVFASTIVNSTGYVTKIPRGLGGAGKGQYKYFAESDYFYNCKAYNKKDRKPGDYILYLNKTSGGHACISGGPTITYEAGYTSKRYGCTVGADSYDPNKKAILGIYRATKPLRKYLQKGDRGEQTKCLQGFLNWAGFSVGTVDGIFGNNTEQSVKKFQEYCGLNPDGKFGEASLTKAKEFIKEVVIYYEGSLPSKTLKKGDKSTDVKYLQNFLDWYDNYELIRDGIFGPRTEEAVKDFQTKEGLEVDGIFGPKSLARAKQYCK